MNPRRRFYVFLGTMIVLAGIAGGVADALVQRSVPAPAAAPADEAPAVAAAPLPTMGGYALGWSPPKTPPPAATKFRLRHGVASSNPRSVDLRSVDVPTVNQGQLGSCTGNAWAEVCQFYLKNRPAAPLGFWGKVERFFTFGYLPKLKAPDSWLPSRLAIYYFERLMEGTVGSDSGAAVQTGAKVVSQLGVAPERLWPYAIAKFRTRPPASYADEAARHKMPAPASIDVTDLDEVRTALAHGHPVILGFYVYSSFESVGRDGVYVPAGRYVGGHCVYIVGYDDDTQRVIVHNSWGEDWGDRGYFYASYAWLTGGQCSDGWTLADDASPVAASPTIPFPAVKPAAQAAAATPRKKAA